MEGILLVDKPKGWTSFDVVNYVRGMVARELGKKPKQVKVGHTGTLDPAATGLLILCIGKKYTSKVPELIRHNKTYLATIKFGASSTTGDEEGVITKDAEPKKIDMATVEETLKKFVGIIDQTPPNYSAIKVDGKRAYELARAGKKVVLKSRKISVHSIKLAEFNWPEIKITCNVGSGTYIRVLAEDIGKEMAVGAYLSDLRRTEVDNWKVVNAVNLKMVDIDTIQEKLLV